MIFNINTVSSSLAEIIFGDARGEVFIMFAGHSPKGVSHHQQHRSQHSTWVKSSRNFSPKKLSEVTVTDEFFSLIKSHPGLIWWVSAGVRSQVNQLLY